MSPSDVGRALCVIPARYGSTRLPGKPLIEVGGLPMVVWVWRTVVRSGAFDRVVVATDDERIVRGVERHGGEAVMTAATHERGTDRVFEAAEKLEAEYVVNVQGDEPEVSPDLLRKLVEHLRRVGDVNSLVTCVSYAPRDEIANPNAVKVVLNSRKEALYFSRAPIPYVHGTDEPFVRHTGVYGFTRSSLKRFCCFSPGKLERMERLEQLRALENGMVIHCVFHQHESEGIDTPADLERFRARVAARQPRGRLDESGRVR